MRLAIEQREFHGPLSPGLSRLLKHASVRSPQSVDLSHCCLQRPFHNQYMRVQLELIDCASFSRQVVTFSRFFSAQNAKIATFGLSRRERLLFSPVTQQFYDVYRGGMTALDSEPPIGNVRWQKLFL
jgi:hypothetical protein